MDNISRQAAIERLREFANDDMTSTEKAIGADYCVDLIRTMPSAQQWIPCSERLPDKCQVVLLSINDGAIYSTVDYWTGDKFDGFDGDAVAWMPLPEPYKGEQE